MRFMTISLPQATMFAAAGLVLLLADTIFFHGQDSVHSWIYRRPHAATPEPSMSSLSSLISAANPLRDCFQVSVSKHLADGKAKAGTSADLLVERVNPETCPFLITEDTLEVSLSGTAIVLAEGVCDETRTRCHFPLRLADPGLYNLSIRVAELVWDGPLDTNHTCFLRSEHRLFLIGGPDRPGLEFVVHSGHEVDRQGCNAEEFYTGRWVSRPTTDSTGALSEPEYDWAPALECDWPAYLEEEQRRHLVQGRWILIIGDSTLEEIGYHLVTAIFKQFREEYNVVDRQNQWEAAPDTRFFDTGVSEDGTRVSFLWCGYPVPNGNFFGVASVLHAEFQANLNKLLGDKVRLPDLLLFNSGLHDLARSRFPDPAVNFTMEGYARDLSLAMQFLSNITTRRVWKNTSPKATYTECGSMFADGTRAAVRRMNRVAVRVAREHGYLIADQKDLNEGLHWMLEGHHCRNKPPCRVFTLSLYNFFDHWWH